MDGQLIEDKKTNAQFLKIDSDAFNDSRSALNRSGKLSNTHGSDYFNLGI